MPQLISMSPKIPCLGGSIMSQRSMLLVRPHYVESEYTSLTGLGRCLSVGGTQVYHKESQSHFLLRLGSRKSSLGASSRSFRLTTLSREEEMGMVKRRLEYHIKVAFGDTAAADLANQFGYFPLSIDQITSHTQQYPSHWRSSTHRSSLN